MGRHQRTLADRWAALQDHLRDVSVGDLALPAAIGEVARTRRERHPGRTITLPRGSMTHLAPTGEERSGLLEHPRIGLQRLRGRRFRRNRCARLNRRRSRCSNNLFAWGPHRSRGHPEGWARGRCRLCARRRHSSFSNDRRSRRIDRVARKHRSSVVSQHRGGWRHSRRNHGRCGVADRSATRGISRPRRTDRLTGTRTCKRAQQHKLPTPCSHARGRCNRRAGPAVAVSIANIAIGISCAVQFLSHTLPRSTSRQFSY